MTGIVAENSFVKTHSLEQADRWNTAFAIARGYLHDLGHRTDGEKTLEWCQKAQQKHGFSFVGSCPRIRDLPVEVLEEFARSLAAAAAQHLKGRVA